MTPVAEGQVVHTATDGVKQAQEGVLEFLLANHPLDCPVCDKGGECPLQDQAFSHGPGESRFVEEKRHFEKPIPISDLVYLDRERCILCDRCTRFADEVAGDPLIHFTHRGNDTQVLTFPDEPFASYFSRQHGADLPGRRAHGQAVPVQGPAVGPRAGREHVHDVLGRLPRSSSSRAATSSLRYQGVDTDPVNWGWLCDRGRFDFEAVNSDRPSRRAAGARRRRASVETSWNAAHGDAAGARPRGARRRRARRDRRARRRPRHERGRVRVGRSSPTRSARQPRRPARRRPAGRACSASPGRPSTRPPRRRRSSCSAPTSRRSCRSSTSGCATPRRSAAAGSSSSSRPTRASRATPGSSVRLRAGRSRRRVADALADAGVAEQLGAGPSSSSPAGPTSPSRRRRRRRPRGAARRRARAPRCCRRSGAATSSARCSSASRPPATAASTALGIAARPPPRASSTCLVLLGADPLADCPDADLARRALGRRPPGHRRRHVPDRRRRRTPTSCSPAAAYGEKAGTTTNLEGRVTTLAQKVTPAGTARPDWMIAADWRSARPRPRLSTIRRRRHRCHRGHRARVRRRHGGGARRRTATASLAVDARRPSLAGRGGRRPRAQHATTSGSWSAASCTTARSARRRSPSLAPLAPGAAAHVHPLDLDRLGVAAGADVRVIGATRHGRAAVVADPAVPRGTVLGAVQPARRRRSRDVDRRSTPPVTDVRIERL